MNNAKIVKDYAIETTEHIVEHAAVVALDHLGEHVFNHAIAPARIVAIAVQDTILSDKSEDEIVENVENGAFNALVAGTLITTLAAGGLTVMGAIVAIPVTIYFAKTVVPIYGIIARGVVKTIRIFK